ncbi:MAG: PIN domain-containing protein [Thermoanaerobaculaceae bacterium]|nr:PIN domain-containing protein [Thermoanaerobaculaceae bacterium]
MTTYVDTSAWLALLDADDQYHDTARAIWLGALERHAPLLTSNYVVVESTAVVQRRLGLDALRALTLDLLPVAEVEWVTPEDHDAATAALLTAGRRTLSLVDCSSFELMRRLGIRSAFTFDKHFIEQGFAALT